MIRAFIAFDLSDEVKEELSHLQNELKKVDADVKWIEPKNIHLTLKFLGNVEEPKTKDIKKVLDDIASHNKKFEITISGLGAFPDIYKMSVIWVGIEKGDSEAKRIAGLIEDALVKMDFPKESRAFRSHFTLGRLKTPRNKVGLSDKMSYLRVQPKSCLIDSIILMQSTLTSHGSIYTPLYVAKFPS